MADVSTPGRFKTASQMVEACRRIMALSAPAIGLSVSALGMGNESMAAHSITEDSALPDTGWTDAPMSLMTLGHIKANGHAARKMTRGDTRHLIGNSADSILQG